MAQSTVWLSVKRVSGILDLIVKFAALSAAMLAANFYLFRADLDHRVISEGEGVDRQIVIKEYAQSAQGVPLVVQATIADIEEGVIPRRYLLSASPFVPDVESLCSQFAEHVRALVAATACRSDKQNMDAVNMARAQFLLLTNNDETFLYRDQSSWVVRTHQPTPPVHSEIFPTPILSPQDLKLAWERIRGAIIAQRVVLILTNTGSAAAENVRITSPIGFRADDMGGNQRTSACIS